MLDKRDYYRLPWSMNDNPIAWLEITDICNIHCDGCYRQHMTGHKSLEQLKEDAQRAEEAGITELVIETNFLPDIQGARDFLRHLETFRRLAA